MIKAFLKYLLPLCIFVLCGHSPVSAHAYQGNTNYAAIKNLTAPAPFSIGHVVPDLEFIPKAYLSATIKEIIKIDVAETEIQEYDFLPIKKYLASSNFLTAIFYAQLLAYLFSYSERFLAFCKHFAAITSHRWFLLFRVFRI